MLKQINNCRFQPRIWKHGRCASTVLDKQSIETLSPPWTTFLRFLDNSGKVQYGEPIDDKYQTVKLIVDGFVSQQIVEVSAVLPPVANPTNIIGVGKNYKNPKADITIPLPAYPVVFHKNTSSMSSHGRNIEIPKITRLKVDYEAELAVVIGRDCKNVSKADALSYVLGYTCANDVSARLWQDSAYSGGQWCFAKSFDTFCPLGPVLVSPTIITNPNSLKISCSLNGEIVQSANTSEMIFDIQSLISFLSQDTTLSPGTVILTGTPLGVGFSRTPPLFLRGGDVVVVEIEKIGKLINTVIE